MDSIARLADEVDVADGTTLMREGDLAREFYMLVEGRVRMERDGQVVKTLGPGDYFGEIGLVVEGRRTTTAIADGPAKLLVITHGGFHSLFETSANLRSAVLEELVDRLRQQDPNQHD